jgi:hypothetical protein
MLVRAMIVPTKVVVVPRVAELPTCQKTSHACVGSITLTTALLAVVSVLPIWKTQGPEPVSVSVPVSTALDE